MTNLKKTVVAALCLALCIVLPFAFHTIPNLASILSPMHLPVLLCGILCGPVYGFLCGALGPIISSLATGMPSAAYLPPMICELAIYGLIAGVFYKYIHTKRVVLDMYISLLGSMIAGRIVAAIVKKFIFVPDSFTLEIWIGSYFVAALPGIISQLIIIPLVVAALTRAKLIPKRY